MSASEVSAFEPQPPAESKVDMPEFVVVRRGVDRRQVEEWGKKLTSLIERERRRAEQAERALYRTQLEARGTPSFTHLGSHAAGIIEEAGQSAERMLLDAAERAQEALAGPIPRRPGSSRRPRVAPARSRVPPARTPSGFAPRAPGSRRRSARRPRGSASRSSRRPAACWRRPGRRPRPCGRRRSGSGSRSRVRPGGWRRCGGAPTSSSRGCTAIWSRSWTRSGAASAAPRTSRRRPSPAKPAWCRRPPGCRAGRRPPGAAGSGRRCAGGRCRPRPGRPSRRRPG